MSQPHLIALYSSTMGSGKSVVAQHLVERHGFKHLKFAGPLKNMIRKMFSDMGMAAPAIEDHIEGRLKEAIMPELGVSPRHLMQTLGTEWGRHCVREDLWVHLTRIAVDYYRGLGMSVVIDDLRFPNEYAMIQEMGGLAVRIVRSSAEATNGHVSEGQLDTMNWQRILFNEGTLDNLRADADTLLAWG